MIRLNKPVKVLEWGKGTNTTNQKWLELATGKIVGKPKTIDGLTTLAIQLDKSIEKQNPADDSVKIAQTGEGMTPNSKDAWGEVAFGRLKNVADGGSGSLIEVEIKTAFKFRNN